MIFAAVNAPISLILRELETAAAAAGGVQDSFYSLALKSLISFSTIILLVLIVAYHALEIQVRLRQPSQLGQLSLASLQGR